MCLLPDYFAFKSTMDIAAKGVADYLLEKLSEISEKLSEILKETMDGLRDFNTKNTAKHIGEMDGWHTALPKNINKAEEFIFVLLLDPEKYIS